MECFASDARVGGKRQRYYFPPNNFSIQNREPFTARTNGISCAHRFAGKMSKEAGHFCCAYLERVPSHIHHLSCSGVSRERNWRRDELLAKLDSPENRQQKKLCNGEVSKLLHLHLRPRGRDKLEDASVQPLESGASSFPPQVRDGISFAAVLLCGCKFLARTRSWCTRINY